jgi:rhamnosyltransferase
VNLLRPFDDAAVVGVFGRQVARADASPMETFFLSRTYHAAPEIKTLGEGEGTSLARCFFSTVSGAIRAATWARHPFREDIIMSEDQAWASEVMREGHSIAYEPSAEVLHSHQYGVAEIFRRNFDSGYSIRQIFRGATGVKPQAALASLVAEAAFVARRGSAIDWLKLLPYEIARHAGFSLGLHADSLPVRLNRICSGLKYFWDQRGGARGLHK